MNKPGYIPVRYGYALYTDYGDRYVLVGLFTTYYNAFRCAPSNEDFIIKTVVMEGELGSDFISGIPNVISLQSE